MREISARIGDVDAQLLILEKSVGQLSERLMPVIEQRCEDNHIAKEESAPDRTPLGGELSRFAFRIRSVREVIDALEAQLQL